jgi:hypothetical protein
MMFPPIFGSAWSNKYGYGTMIHEFGHYGLWLDDEYLRSDGSGGGFCTFNRQTAPEETRASIMYDSDDASELCSEADPNHLHNPDTLQHATNNAESTWETVIRVYSDTQNPARWVLQSPDTRQVPVVPGPNMLPVFGWMNVYVDDNVTNVCAPFTVLVTYPDGTPVPKAAVSVGMDYIHPEYPQGLTDDAGKIVIRGGYSGDSLYGKKDNASGSIEINCSLVGAEAGTTPATQQTLVLTPYIENIWVDYVPLNDHIIQVMVTPSGGLLVPPQAQLWQDGSSTPIDVPLVYDSGMGAYIGQAGLNTGLDLLGSTTVQAVDSSGNTLYNQVPFILQNVNAEGTTKLRSADGQMEIFLPQGSLSGAPIVNIQAASQANLQQSSLRVLGVPYEVNVSDGQNSLLQPAVLNIHFSTSHFDLLQEGRIGIYQWDEVNETWILISTDIDSENQLISAEITELGTYAVMAPPMYFYNLPIVNK